MDKKIKNEMAVGIILIVAIIIGGLFYFNISKTAFGPGGMPIQNENSSQNTVNTISKKSPAVFKMGNTKIIKSQIIDSAGGDIKIENSQTPLDGFVINFPAGALKESANISVGYNDGIFESLPTGTPTGKTIVIITAGVQANNLSVPISITFSSDSKQVIGFSVNSDGRLSPIDTVAYKPIVKNHTFVPNTIITWIYVDNN